MPNNRYEDPDIVGTYIETNRHRGFVGGMWDELGHFQYDALLQAGLRPEHYLLDAGCGALRGGRLLIDYLQPNHYFGTDLNIGLLDAGYEKELDDAARTRLPRAQLAAVAIDAPVPFKVSFDFIFAFSLFTHLPGPIVRQGLQHLAAALRRDAEEPGQILATFFLSATLDQAEQAQRDNIVTYKDRDPFHFAWGEVVAMAAKSGLTAEEVTPFPHPRGQRLIKFAPIA